MAKGAVIARILSEYDAKGTKQARKDLAELQGKFSEFGKKATEAFAAVAAASAAMAIAFGVEAVKAAMSEQKAMAVLNNTLHNTVGANEAVMASTEAYIKQAAVRYNFTTDQIIPSLQSLVVATKDVSKAETLQHLAMDISANKGKDLNEVSLAIAKAYLGNFNALKRMGVPLSETIIKHKDFTAAIKELNASFGGSAAAAADTFAGRIGRIGIAFDIVKKTIGNAIIVALQPFLDKFIAALPKIQAWLDTNSKKIAAFFITGISYGAAFGQTLYEIFNFVATNMKAFAELGAVLIAIFAGVKIAAGISAFIEGITTIVKVMKVLREASLAAGFAEAIATGGVSAAAGLAAATAAFVGINVVLNKFDDNVKKNSKNVGDIKFNFKGLTSTATDYIKGLNGINTATSTNTKLTKDQIATLDLLKKMGVTPTDQTQYDAIEQKAALLNLQKQSNNEEQARVQALLDSTQAQITANAAIARYNDILTVLADNHVSSAEVALLADKWGISQNAVVAYIAQVTGAAAFDPKDLGSPGAVAAQGWTNALAELNAYYDKLGHAPVVSSPLTMVTPPTLPSVNPPSVVTPSISTTPSASSVFTSSTLPYNIPSTVLGGIVLPNTPTASFGATDTAAQYGFGANFMSGTSGATGNTTIIVNGNVQTKSDNVASIRQDLLQGQLSGKAVSLLSVASL
jgi:hypothetical protein